MGKSTTWQDFAAYIRCIREQRGLTQKQLAEQIGCSEMYVWKLEHGRRHPSKIILVLLRRDYLLDAEDIRLFNAFEMMREYQCDSICLEDV